MERLKGEPFVLLGVNSDSDREALKTTLEEERINWRSWWDDGGIFGPIQTQWAVAKRPTIHLIDWTGTIRHMNVDSVDLDDAIDKLLREQAASSNN